MYFDFRLEWILFKVIKLVSRSARSQSCLCPFKLWISIVGPGSDSHWQTTESLVKQLMAFLSHAVCSTYIAPGGGRWYLIFCLSRRVSSLYPSVLENRSQSSIWALSLSVLSVTFSHSALCHALSAKASRRGKISECSCSGFLTVSLQNAPDMPENKSSA